jgi:hypothetical protein
LRYFAFPAFATPLTIALLNRNQLHSLDGPVNKVERS